MIACEENSRRACVMELEPYYCDQIVRRYLSFSGRADAVLLRDSREIPFSEAAGR